MLYVFFLSSLIFALFGCNINEIGNNDKLSLIIISDLMTNKINFFGVLKVLDNGYFSIQFGHK